MRIARLDLSRYGHFTDTRLDLAPGATDLHIVYGPNEAGKSTARSAIGDFLFGFPKSTALGFMHGYGQLRIGARCEYAHGTIDAIRRKGNKATLLDEQGHASAALEAELQRVLAGATGDFFTRMFSLDHEGLRRGADDLIAPDANADSALLAAGSGLGDLLGQRRRLAEEADALWAPTHSKNRRFYQADARLKDAGAAIREHEVTVREWQRLRDDHAAAETAYQALATQRRELSTEREALERVRRVALPARRYRQTQAELAALADTVRLPDDAGTIFDAARDTDRAAQQAIAEQSDNAERLTRRIEAIDDDPALRAEAETIDSLAESRKRIAEDRGRMADLAMRRKTAAAALADERATLGLAEDHDSWPAAAKITRARQLIGEHASLAQTLSHARAGYSDVAQRHQEIDGDWAAAGDAIDTTAMAAWLDARSTEGDLDGERRTAAADATRIERDIAARLSALQPGVTDIETLDAMTVPDDDRVERFAEQIDAAENTLARRRDEHQRLADEFQRAAAARERERAGSVLPSEQDLAALREQRDRCWARIRRHHIEGHAKDLVDQAGDDDWHEADTADPVAALAALMRDADRLADTRFEHAQAIAALAEQDKTLADREYALDQAATRQNEAETQLAALTADWRALWRPANIEPTTPTAMRAWLNRRTELVETRVAGDQAAARLAELDQRIAAYQEQLRTHLAGLGVDAAAPADGSLNVLFQHARRVVEAEVRRADYRSRLAKDRRKIETQLDAQTSRCTQAENALGQWQTRWQDLLSRLGLSPDTTVENGASTIDTLDSARQHAATLREIDTERDGIAARHDAFRSRLAQVLEATARPALTDDTLEQASRQLSAALRDAQTNHGKLEDNRAALDGATDRISEHEQRRTEARRQLDALMSQAGVQNAEQLAEAIDASARLHALEREQTRIADTLNEQGDGHTIEALLAAVDAADPDALAAQVAELDEQIADLNTQAETARDERNAAQRAFDSIGGGDRAAVAAAERENALADMQDAAERYLRVGTAAILLKWTAQRYSTDKQRPILDRGSMIMNTLTGGSIARVATAFDANDLLQLVGMRADGSTLAPTAMSEGTRDQLYLALRVAAIEDYLTRAEALPVIADDLFINFDDERAMAGLDVLAELAEHTQVLFFTHHQHLRDMALERLGKRVSTHDL